MSSVYAWGGVYAWEGWGDTVWREAGLTKLGRQVT